MCAISDAPRMLRQMGRSITPVEVVYVFAEGFERGLRRLADAFAKEMAQVKQPHSMPAHHERLPGDARREGGDDA